VFSAINDAPVITCLEVHEAGDVTIYWQSLDISVQEFKIYSSIDNTNWDLVGTVDSQNQNLQINHSSARADTIMHYYEIKAFYSGGIEVSSGIFKTIFLEVVPNIIFGRAELYWNEVRIPLPEGSSTYYKIYKSNYEVGLPATWDIIDSTEHTSYNYIIEDGVCGDSINFKIEIDNSYGCHSSSNIAGELFTENNQPEKPTLDSVSIINNNNVIIGWDPSISTDVIGTIISRWENDNGVNKWINIDTVYNATSYIDTDYNPCDTNYLYSIAALPICGLPSPKTEETAQRPILFHGISYNLCSKTNSLTWEPYIHALTPFTKYEIWSSKNSGSFVLVDEIPATDNYYNHVDVDNATDYSYFIRAVFNNLDFTSTSCTKSIITGTFLKPDSVYLANATVLTNNFIELTLDVDLKPETCTWDILRSDVGGGNQSIIHSLTRNDITTSPYTYIDETADGSTGYYTYSIVVTDSCGSSDLQSNPMTTMFLHGEKISNTENSLSWNLFEGFEGDIDKYYIFRMLGDVIPLIPIDSVDLQTNTYIDDISTVPPSESKISYWVQASEKILNTYGYKEKSNSNIISLFKEINFYFPNAFRPNGTNNIFKPVAVGFGGSNYLLQIYNRWGQLIFESSEYDLGWDGNYKENPSPQGTYIYKLVYDNVFGVNKQQKGSVTLID
jgi:gliding motility-associated-like protein